MPPTSNAKKWLSDKKKVEHEKHIARARTGRRARHSTPEESAAAQDEIADYLSRVPQAPTYNET